MIEKSTQQRLVVHCKLEPFDIYIGRPSIWGNPFSHKTGTLAKFQVANAPEAVSKYREWLLCQPELIERVKRELKGKVLGCWCKTQRNPNAPCHGDVLIEFANYDSET